MGCWLGDLAKGLAEDPRAPESLEFDNKYRTNTSGIRKDAETRAGRARFCAAGTGLNSSPVTTSAVAPLGVHGAT